jgi:hypothetical protein
MRFVAVARVTGPLPPNTLPAGGAEGQRHLLEGAAHRAQAVGAGHLGPVRGAVARRLRAGRRHDRQVPPLAGEALTAVKRTLDPAWTLNPGVLLGVP